MEELNEWKWKAVLFEGETLSITMGHYYSLNGGFCHEKNALKELTFNMLKLLPLRAWLCCSNVLLFGVVVKNWFTIVQW